ncbi:pirin family protein [Marinilongibacter aquaticus]|uniref:pirin family protein n=1 Tax=Marinilongibacter aquaticus TaxID=2975157 RepID=UPI0021BDE452|nr:pirin family protein [Marinilongibacter aquaticus]UBM59799.1 pirin family protein [Marinilongibacter aquaticus]
MNNKMLVEERSRDLGNFLVGRLLPFAKKRQVGPFTFIDHMGPVEMKAPQFMDVDQHPHIGLSTLTYLIEGQIHHHDSTGADRVIEAGDVGFMTSGKGVTHTERTPENLRGTEPVRMHGYQVWVALPKEVEESEPHFQFIPKTELPVCERDGLEIRLVAGEAFGLKSPLQVYSPLFMVDVYSANAKTLNLAGQVQGEIAFVVVEGEVSDNDSSVSAGQMLISKTEDECEIKLAAHTRLLIFGGQPLPEQRYLLWNFVSSSKEKLKQAAEDWKAHKFPKTPHDETYIPLPEHLMY